ncbi:hypothetical protein [Rubritalea profundi]|uniref:Uncharacterized protein n=1 Tax=Rubritalea profundi TaxID=1658618 RepID=A0A2S7TYM0_9BACT|nr:hypothetical protein [Rubritalea profundi]PQJ27855.1 hypothetical protein BSZ32_04635 [Rubritalea profundi]
MGHAYLYFLGLLLVGLVAASKFASLATSKGYQGGKAKRYPLLLMIAAMGAAVVLLLGAIVIGIAMPHWQGAVSSVFLVGNWFIIALNLLVLKLAYKNMKVAPDCSGGSSER